MTELDEANPQPSELTVTDAELAMFEIMIDRAVYGQEHWGLSKDTILKIWTITHELRRLRQKPDIRDLAEWWKKQPMELQYLAKDVLEGVNSILPFFPTILDTYGETASWIVSASEGNLPRALDELEQAVSRWKEEQHVGKLWY